MTELDTVIVPMVSKLDAINQKVQLALGSSNLKIPECCYKMEILGTSPAKGPKNKGFLGSVPTRSPWKSCCRAGDVRWKNELTWLRRFRMS